eukprot:2079447-Prymnesium_polylepis.1
MPTRLPRPTPAGGVQLSDADGITLTVHPAIAEIARDAWDACAQGEASPFVAWEWLHQLERSGSACAAEGWTPQHLVARDAESGAIVGAVAAYEKAHSHGEFVFDQMWARAYSALASPLAPQSYYPKLQVCVPFTPVTSPRLLIASDLDDARRDAVRRALCRGLRVLSTRLGVSSAHVTFASEACANALAREGYLLRHGLQYHWQNEGYTSFDDFLMALKQSRRKAIRQERDPNATNRSIPNTVILSQTLILILILTRSPQRPPLTALLQERKKVRRTGLV